ncbi:hypothetical protein B1992_04350 [Pseudoxanthomonas broegbernensis]|uniref:Uncharacterized protein n=1 Tax=Pseudoxanthomonas broegbernensis TaxID=83619 RepID=A0A7V8K827_9GAMM|nr:hypothetical protein B1992_04350 [Pseudoxanthomonas broegbernensis]
MTVTALAVAYALRGNQQRQLATHSVTTAQASAWRGVEFLRDALAGMSATDEGKMILYGLSYGHPPAGGCIPAGGGAGGCGSFEEAAGWNSASAWKPGEDAELSEPLALQVDDGFGFDAYLLRVRKSASFQSYEVTAQVIGRAAGSAAAPLATSTVEVVYEVGGSSGSTTGTCASLPSALMVFNGDLDITGGSLGVTDGESTDYANIAVAGSLTVGSSSSARISGCAKGNITLSGGGITNDGYLHAEGDISVTGMTPPNGTTFWGRSISLDGSSSGARYAALRAGAYTASVMANGTAVGTTRVGGKLVAATASGGIPWTTGTVVPDADSATFVIELSDGSQFVLDPDDLVIDAATGAISGARVAAERLSGEGELPDSFTLQAGSIFGGGIGAEGLAQTGLVWGHDVRLGLGAGGGLTGAANVAVLRVNGGLTMGTGNIGTLVGGGDLWAKGAGRGSPTNHWNFPTVAGSGAIAGQMYYGVSKAPLPAGEGMAAVGAADLQAGTTPGLPGIPYCDARVRAVDAEAYKAQANYVFEFVDGLPTLTVRNVKAASGVSIDGTYNLLTGDLRRMPAGTGAPFLACNWQGAGNAGAHCFRDATPTGGWNITGLVSFPKGVVWFDGDFTVNGTDGGRDLVNTIIGTSKVTLTQSGHGDLVAPNFSTPATLCDGDFWPTNLCDKSGGTSQFATWTERVLDEDGTEKEVEHVGLPIGNMAVIVEGAGQLSGWNIFGSVILGRNLGTAANVTVVQGTLTVGANQSDSTTLIDQGGARITVPTESDQMHLPVCESIPAIPTPGAQVQWSRYL